MRTSTPPPPPRGCDQGNFAPGHQRHGVLGGDVLTAILLGLHNLVLRGFCSASIKGGHPGVADVNGAYFLDQGASIACFNIYITIKIIDWCKAIVFCVVLVLPSRTAQNKM